MVYRNHPLRLLLAPVPGLLLTFGLAGCGGGNGFGLSPLQEGDTFVYEATHSGTRISHVFSVEAATGGFVVRRSQVAVALNGDRAETRILHSEKVYDRHGRLSRLADGRRGGRCVGHLCFLWLPPEYRVDGARLRLSEAADELVAVAETRNGRPVLVVHHGQGAFYYDPDGGLLLGHTAYGALRRTNRVDLCGRGIPALSIL